jgi:elongator complex protein 3
LGRLNPDRRARVDGASRLACWVNSGDLGRTRHSGLNSATEDASVSIDDKNEEDGRKRKARAQGQRLAGRFRGRGPDRSFDPRPMRDVLVPLLRAIEAVPDELPDPLAPEVMEPLLRSHAKPGGGFFSRSQLIAAFRAFSPQDDFRFDEARFRRRVQRRPVRTQSGVTPLTVLTKPFPCPGQCIFCPNDVRMPKSYLADEPGAQRAANNRFDPYLQTWNRLAAFDATGHPTDKVELIVLGGTWSFYPLAYQIYFVSRCLDAMNDFGAGRDLRDAFEPTMPDFEKIDADIQGDAFSKNVYNQRVTRFLQDELQGKLVVADEESDWETLSKAQRLNESAGARCVGLVLETRPDHIDEEEVLRLRRLGATKVQLGVQSLDDHILELNQRGHDVEATRRAFDLLRRAGFKLHVHWMANLLGATPDSDCEDFRRLFEDPSFRPDELKLYPCSLVETAELMGPWRRGEWRPYEDDELLRVVADALPRVPRWCRVTRVIRDISSDDIVAGNKRTNFRQIAEAEVSRRGERLVEIRQREIRGEKFEATKLELVETEYATEAGREIFLELITAADRIVGFLRLSLPERPSFVDELGASALIRELHVYGGSVQIGSASGGRAQHRGLGGRLLLAAESTADKAGYGRLSVISAIGTRGYYRQQGFDDGELYQHRSIEGASSESAASKDSSPDSSSSK